MKDSKLKRRLNNLRNTETQRERRRKDPAYREAYNKMRLEYYYAKKKKDPKYMEKLRKSRKKRTDEGKANEGTELSSGK